MDAKNPQPIVRFHSVEGVEDWRSESEMQQNISQDGLDCLCNLCFSPHTYMYIMLFLNKILMKKTVFTFTQFMHNFYWDLGKFLIINIVLIF